MTKSDIAREWRTKHPETPSLKLARMIMNSKSGVAFKDVEDARDRLRYIEGKKGNRDRKLVASTDYFKSESRPYNPYNLPETHKEDREPFILPAQCNNILFISDLHIPYHDIEAITIALDYGKKEKINTVFINGDLVDNYHMSKFEKDPRKRSVKQELDAVKQFLVTLRKTFPNAEIFWLYGNHDIRYEKWLMTKAYEIFEDEYYHLEQRLRLREERIKNINDKTLVKAGKLSITHGHHIMRGFFSPVNSARGAYMKAKQSTIISHVHKVSTHSETNMDGKVITCWSTGSLCETKPDYSPLVSNYQHGFAHVLIDSTGDYSVKNFQIINGKLH